MKHQETKEKTSQEGRNPEDYGSIDAKGSQLSSAVGGSSKMSFECVGMEPFHFTSEDSVVCVWGGGTETRLKRVVL